MDFHKVGLVYHRGHLSATKVHQNLIECYSIRYATPKMSQAQALFYGQVCQMSRLKNQLKESKSEFTKGNKKQQDFSQKIWQLLLLLLLIILARRSICSFLLHDQSCLFTNCELVIIFYVESQQMILFKELAESWKKNQWQKSFDNFCHGQNELFFTYYPVPAFIAYICIFQHYHHNTVFQGISVISWTDNRDNTIIALSGANTNEK